MNWYLCRIPESIPQKRIWLGISTSPRTSAGCIHKKCKFLDNILTCKTFHQSFISMPNDDYLANHCKKFVSLTTCRSHLVHHTTRSSNNVILHLVNNMKVKANQHNPLKKWLGPGKVHLREGWENIKLFGRAKQDLLGWCLILKSIW